jgi:hypothetical protein
LHEVYQKAAGMCKILAAFLLAGLGSATLPNVVVVLTDEYVQPLMATITSSVAVLFTN